MTPERSAGSFASISTKAMRQFSFARFTQAWFVPRCTSTARVTLAGSDSHLAEHGRVVDDAEIH